MRRSNVRLDRFLGDGLFAAAAARLRLFAAAAARLLSELTEFRTRSRTLSSQQNLLPSPASPSQESSRNCPQKVRFKSQSGVRSTPGRPARDAGSPAGSSCASGVPGVSGVAGVSGVPGRIKKTVCLAAHEYVRACVQTDMRADGHACVQTDRCRDRKSTYMHACRRTCVQTCMRADGHACRRTCVQTDMRACRQTD